jgi:AAA+ ATPase superfamily predicted ATPase
MDFIGRTSELATLNAELERGSGFVVIYGRRRVGKTTLIKEFIKDKRAFYFLATTESEAQSMKRFAGVLSRTTKKPMLSKVTFTDWLDLFQVVADDHPDEKKVLVIDEFPYLVKTNPDFPSILQNAWDEVLKDHNVMLILCGSLISMMKKHALAYDSPLYGRRTAQIRLMPLQFTDVYEAQNLSFEQAVEQYAITGGVPKYMEFFQSDEPLVEQIRRVVLSKNGFLYEEPDFLLNEEVQTPINYFSVLKAISDGNHKLSKIGMTMEQDTSAITPYLKTLIDLGFVIKNVPITEKNPERSRKSLYYVSDNFIRFWFRYVYPFKGELELDNQQIVLDEIGKDFKQKFVAFAYESICRNIFAELCRKGQIDFAPSRIGSYWRNDNEGDTEIDVAAVDHQHKRLFLGECKYHTKPVDVAVYSALQEKGQSKELIAAFKGYGIVYGLFSKSGFTDRLVEMVAENSDLILIQADAVYKK